MGCRGFGQSGVECFDFAALWTFGFLGWVRFVGFMFLVGAFRAGCFGLVWDWVWDVFSVTE